MPPRGDYQAESAEGGAYPPQKEYDAGGYGETAPAAGDYGAAAHRGRGGSGGGRRGGRPSNGHPAPDPTNLYMSFE